MVSTSTALGRGCPHATFPGSQKGQGPGCQRARGGAGSGAGRRPRDAIVASASIIHYAPRTQLLNLRVAQSLVMCAWPSNCVILGAEGGVTGASTATCTAAAAEGAAAFGATSAGGVGVAWDGVSWPKRVPIGSKPGAGSRLAGSWNIWAVDVYLSVCHPSQMPRAR
jgi:hypothetical protein